MSMIIVEAVAITEAMMVSDVLENDYPEYDAGTAYALGDRVIMATQHKIYESLQAANTGHDPSLAASAAWWIEVSATNLWKPFDASNASQMTAAVSCYFELTTGEACNAAAVFNASCGTLRIRVTDPVDGVVYDETINMAGDIPSPDWYSWYFARVLPKTQWVALDLPLYPSAVIRFDFTGDAIAVGGIMVGRQEEVGNFVLNGVRVGLQDYSRKETNSFGDTVLVQGAYAKRVDVSMVVDNADISDLWAILVAKRATRCLWVIDPLYPLLGFDGFYNDFDVTIPYENESICTLTIEGMT